MEGSSPSAGTSSLSDLHRFPALQPANGLRRCPDWIQSPRLEQIAISPDECVGTGSLECRKDRHVLAITRELDGCRVQSDDVSPYAKLAKYQTALDEFVLPVEIAGFDHEAAGVYGRVRAALRKKATSVGSSDSMIGALALVLGATRVGNNT